MKPPVLGCVIAFAACFLAAAETETPPLRFAACDGLVRDGLIFRCQVQREVSSGEFERGPYVLQLVIEAGGRVLVSGEFPIARLGQMREGVQAALIPTLNAEGDDGQPLLVHATLADQYRHPLQRLDRELTSPLRLQRCIETLYRRIAVLDPDKTEPLPYLWTEEAGELMNGGASLKHCARLDELGERMAQWLAGNRPALSAEAANTLALHDVTDGSVQPLRLHLPAGDGPCPVALVLARYASVPEKSAWPMLPEAWLAAARSAGLAVVEVYPAGDIAWSGIGPRRAFATLAAAARACPRLRVERVTLIGIGAGAAGAVLLAEEQPWRCAALTLVDAQLPTAERDSGDPLGRWFALHVAGARPEHLIGLPISMSGAASAASEAWKLRVERAGGAILTGFQMPDVPGFWFALAKNVKARDPHEYVVLAPGRFGVVEVRRMQRWGEAGSLRWDGEQPDQLHTVGIGSLRLDPPGHAAIDGHDYVPPTTPEPVPSKSIGQALGPLDGYAAGPFAVVVGTGEHAAALADNRELARAFIAAWAAHAQGLPPLIDDTAFRAEDFPRHHLVLIGNLRSNRVLAELIDAARPLPISWDSRSLTCRGRSLLRGEHRSVALAWPHPAHDGRLLVILDGRPSWTAGLPLAGLPDLVIGGEHPGDAPALSLLFDNAWR